jgi:hypothetical protein
MRKLAEYQRAYSSYGQAKDEQFTLKLGDFKDGFEKVKAEFSSQFQDVPFACEWYESFRGRVDRRLEEHPTIFNRDTSIQCSFKRYGHVNDRPVFCITATRYTRYDGSRLTRNW